MTVRVSILIPCFNAERWIGQAIESALAQTWPDREVIVVDDGSTDGSLGEIRRFGDRIQWESGPNRGGNRARNRLLELARGEWLQYLDADDYLQPDKVRGQVACLTSHPEADVLYGPITIDRTTETGSYLEVLPIPEPHDDWVLLAEWWLPQTGASLWRRAALIDVGGWKADQAVCQEHELYLRLLKAGKVFRYCSHPGAVWRIWGRQSLSLANAALVRRHRASIEQDAEDFLRAAGQLTPPRHAAINAARFRMARVAWRECDTDGAVALIQDIQRSAPRFAPTFEPFAYRILWHALGFAGAERVAAWRRSWRPA